MSNYSGFKNTTFRTSVVAPMPTYKGRTICYENGKRLWQETSKIIRMSRGDALRDAQKMAHDHIVSNFLADAGAEAKSYAAASNYLHGVAGAVTGI